MLKFLHGTIDANKQPLFLRVWLESHRRKQIHINPYERVNMTEKSNKRTESSTEIKIRADVSQALVSRMNLR